MHSIVLEDKATPLGIEYIHWKLLLNVWIKEDLIARPRALHRTLLFADSLLPYLIPIFFSSILLFRQLEYVWYSYKKLKHALRHFHSFFLLTTNLERNGINKKFVSFPDYWKSTECISLKLHSWNEHGRIILKCIIVISTMVDHVR